MCGVTVRINGRPQGSPLLLRKGGVLDALESPHLPPVFEVDVDEVWACEAQEEGKDDHVGVHDFDFFLAWPSGEGKPSKT